MQEQIGFYLNKLERKKHLKELMKNINLSIIFEVNKQEYCLCFKEGNIQKNVESLKDYYITRIGGEEGAITSLLNGELKLRIGEASHHLKVTGNFRSKLLLESLFYLGGRKNS